MKKGCQRSHFPVRMQSNDQPIPDPTRIDKDASGHKGSQENLSETVENYETAFEKIKTVTNTNDINELVKRFTQVEDQNFSLFNYVNEINNGIEILSDEIKEINGQIEHFREDGVRVDNERKQALKELEVRQALLYLATCEPTLYTIVGKTLAN